MLKAKWGKILTLLFTTYIISCEKVGFFQCFLKGLLTIRKFSSNYLCPLDDFAMVLHPLEHNLLIIFSLSFLKQFWQE